MGNRTDNELLRVIAAGTPEQASDALGELFKKHEALLRHILRTKGSGGEGLIKLTEEDIEDLLQETRLRLWEYATSGKLKTEERADTTASGLLAKLSIQIMWDHFKFIKAGKRAPNFIAHSLGEPAVERMLGTSTKHSAFGSTAPTSVDEKILLQKALDKLPAHLRQAIVADAQGYSAEEIAEEMGNKGLSTVKRYKQEARIKLGELLPDSAPKETSVVKEIDWCAEYEKARLSDESNAGGRMMRARRELAGISPAAVAIASGIKIWNIREYESGKRHPDKDKAYALANVEVEIDGKKQLLIPQADHEIFIEKISAKPRDRWKKRLRAMTDSAREDNGRMK